MDSRCKQLDISLSAFISHPGADDNPRLKSAIISLGTLGDIGTRAERCHLCRLIKNAYRTGPLQAAIGLSDLDRIEIFVTWVNALGPSKEQRLKSPALCLLIWPESPQFAPGSYKIVVRAVSNSLLHQAHFGRLAPAEPSLLDFNEIKKWLRHCEDKHETCRAAAQTNLPQPTKHFHVIDVRYRCIVKAPDNCRYFALSYVWGEAKQLQTRMENFNIHTQKHSLQERHLKKTISDAMFLTQKLGERYLWVDALCIVQDVDVVRQQSIENMDRIYAQSLCTIVAGTCKDANEHLPGVTQKTQWTQFLEPVSRSLTLSAHFDYKDHLEATKYNQRAWTFQEFQLAHRLLIFAPNNQTYFSCASAVYSEEVEPGPTLDHDMCMLDGMHSLKLSPGKNHIWSTYQRAVRNLTSRHMSHERDILNAFAGILRRICPERSIEGLAVPIFDLALLWQPRERLRRRTGFSSWAWAGWMGRVGWFDDGALSAFADASACETQQVGEWTRARAWIVWYSSWGTNIMSAAYLLDGPPWLRGSAPGREIQEERFRGLSTGNFAPRPDMIPRRLRGLERQRRHIRYLQFWTVSVYFQIELNDAAVLRWKSFQPESTGDGLRLFLLRDRFDEACGWVLLDEGWVEKGKTSDIRNQEFILLSEGSSPRDEGNNEEVEDETGGGIDDREFNTMMITWIDGIAERAGVGRVRRTALANSCWRDMKWKEIVLG